MSPYTLEFEGGSVREWTLTETGSESRLVEDYTPSLFVSGPHDALSNLRERLEDDPKVAATGYERWATDLHEAHVEERSRMLRIDLERIGEVRTLAREIRGVHERETHAPGTFRLFDVDLAPGFRYCLDRGIDPTPSRDLRTLSISLSELALADGDVSALRLEGDSLENAQDGSTAEIDTLRTLQRRLERDDPDVLVVSHARVIPLLETRAEDYGLETFRLGRRPGWTRLAGENTYASYGQVGHSPARYRVPGRAIVDRSNSFLWHQSGLDGLLYMIDRTGRPLQEAAWGSIGTLLTARQVRLARDRDVLAPWNKWEPERFTDVRTLHAADRGGFTFAPDVGFHENVYEIDFASLYPRIICEHNISPETVDCGCGHGSSTPGTTPDGPGDGHCVPELEYRICGEDGFLPDVLEPLLVDRATRKRRLAEDPPADEAARLRGESGAIKWVLVSCFGYQGYRNAKFGRIECHEAINAYAREIVLEAKRRLEDAGWRIVHGIVDSLWVTPRVDDPTPLSTVTADVSDSVGIELERDGSYEWVCFVPRRDSIGRASGATRAPTTNGRSGPGSVSGIGSGPAGALTKYFGKRREGSGESATTADAAKQASDDDGKTDAEAASGDGGSYKIRGLECRQRSTPPFVAECQRQFVELLDRERKPEAVCDVLGRRLSELRSGSVDPSDLEITKRVSKPIEAYRQRTHTVAALERYRSNGIDRSPGQSVRYVVSDDDAAGAERVRLSLEEPTTYDDDWYATALIRACESVVSPLGWDRGRIRSYLRDGTTVRLSSFGNAPPE
ncbi:DNA polymerase domain-containing protein [Natrarchaeobius chitinivorans]|uniref:DNA-directed DNA polymerase n=1 Tax=Natrarchaeobius chitinivorans TaxID=1679083 RepID=A0A3N6M712_NATCH|nr:DNA polymerase domain-containing protein [Natrarchaeobius chitinivorans]RQG98017.1 DNA polymerase I [Natrarchaeobius chitinivorans]